MTEAIAVIVVTEAIGAAAAASVGTVAAMAEPRCAAKVAMTPEAKQKPKVVLKAEPTAEANAWNAPTGRLGMKWFAQSPSTLTAVKSTQFANATKIDRKVAVSSRAAKIAAMVAVALAPSVKLVR